MNTPSPESPRRRRPPQEFLTQEAPERQSPREPVQTTYQQPAPRRKPPQRRTKRARAAARIDRALEDSIFERIPMPLRVLLIAICVAVFLTSAVGITRSYLARQEERRRLEAEAAERAQHPLEYAGLTGNETVWDLYCGIGTISLFLAQKAKQVYGVEIVPEAIRDAKQNAELNGFTNAEFFVGKAEEVLPEKYEKEGIFADVIVVDPPRKGCEESVLQTMIQMAPKRIVYVSCDSATLARDLKILCENGYELQKCCPVDMFGNSVHVESVVLLSRK